MVAGTMRVERNDLGAVDQADDAAGARARRAAGEKNFMLLVDVDVDREVRLCRKKVAVNLFIVD